MGVNTVVIRIAVQLKVLEGVLSWCKQSFHERMTMGIHSLYYLQLDLVPLQGRILMRRLGTAQDEWYSGT